VTFDGVGKVVFPSRTRKTKHTRGDGWDPADKKGRRKVDLVVGQIRKDKEIRKQHKKTG